MKWTLNTTRACTAADLGANLKSELDHFSQTQPHSRAVKEVPEITPVEMKEMGVTDPAQMRQIFAETDTKREEIMDLVVAKLSDVEKQALAAIGAAVAVAKAMGTDTTLFHATIAGHHDMEREDGIHERVNIAVDIAG